MKTIGKPYENYRKTKRKPKVRGSRLVATGMVGAARPFKGKPKESHRKTIGQL